MYSLLSPFIMILSRLVSASKAPNYDFKRAWVVFKLSLLKVPNWLCCVWRMLNLLPEVKPITDWVPLGATSSLNEKEPEPHSSLYTMTGVFLISGRNGFCPASFLLVTFYNSNFSLLNFLLIPISVKLIPRFFSPLCIVDICFTDSTCVPN